MKKEEVLLQSSIDGEAIWGEPKQDFYKIGDFDKNCDDGCKYHCTKGNTQLAECLKEPKHERSYTEEEVLELLNKSCDYIYDSSKIGTDKKLMPNLLRGWFEQFKNK